MVILSWCSDFRYLTASWCPHRVPFFVESHFWLRPPYAFLYWPLHLFFLLKILIIQVNIYMSEALLTRLWSIVRANSLSCLLQHQQCLAHFAWVHVYGYLCCIYIRILPAWHQEPYFPVLAPHHGSFCDFGKSLTFSKPDPTNFERP